MRIELGIPTTSQNITENKREHKGKSFISFPKDYVIIDIETTGLDPNWDSIIGVSAQKYSNNEFIEEFTTLVQPDSKTSHMDTSYWVDSYITELTGITNEMLDTAPPFSEIAHSLYSFIEKSILIGHNVNFDINFLYDNFEENNIILSNDFIDTMRISRKLHPELSNHKLSTLCDFYKISVQGMHRSSADCRMTFQCYSHMLNEITNKEDFIASFKRSYKQLSANDISSSKEDFDETHPLYGRVCVFTGTLQKMQRKDAMQIVADFGGINADGVTAKTNYLILGNNDYCSTIKDGKSLKQKKAEQLKLKGQDIEIITENVFYDMIEN